MTVSRRAVSVSLFVTVQRKERLTKARKEEIEEMKHFEEGEFLRFCAPDEG